MAIKSKFIAIGLIILSFLAGYAIYYLFSQRNHEEKKRILHEITSELINFVIFLWVAKILLNLSLFLSDPLSVLAYPSNSTAFYVATFFSMIFIYYKSKRGKLIIFPFIQSFVFIFICSSFVYEFIQIAFYDNRESPFYLIVLALIIAIDYLLKERLKEIDLLMLIVILWGISVIALSFVQPFITVFQFIMSPVYTSFLLMIAIGFYMNQKRRKELS